MSNLQFIIDGLIESFEEKKIQNSSKYEKFEFVCPPSEMDYIAIEFSILNITA